MEISDPIHEAELKRLKTLPAPPPRIAGLKKDPRGYPVPWFVHWERDIPDFRVIREHGRERAFRAALCWICGGKMGTRRVFVIGPMCCVNRTTMEPPCHRECAEYAAIACPFLVRPKMRRLPHEEGEFHAPGDMIERNPGVTCLYEARDYAPFRTGGGRDDWLIRLGKPTKVDFWREGRSARRDEIMESIASGLPNLERAARAEGPEAVNELRKLAAEALKLLPA